MNIIEAINKSREEGGSFGRMANGIMIEYPDMEYSFTLAEIMSDDWVVIDSRAEAEAVMITQQDLEDAMGFNGRLEETYDQLSPSQVWQKIIRRLK